MPSARKTIPAIRSNTLAPRGAPESAATDTTWPAQAAIGERLFRPRLRREDHPIDYIPGPGEGAGFAGRAGGVSPRDPKEKLIPVDDGGGTMEKNGESYEEKAEDAKESPSEGSGMDMEDSETETERAEK